MKNLMLLFILIIVNCVFALAQNTGAVRRLQKDAKSTVKFNDYAEAIKLYDSLARMDPNNLEYSYQLGVCYLKSPKKKEALPYFLKVSEKAPNYNEHIELMLGQAYHYRGEYEEAKKHYLKAKTNYEQYITTIPGNNKLSNKEKIQKTAEINNLIKECEKRAEECENGLKLASQPVNASIENLGSSINTEYPEYMPLIPQDESFLVFTSRRENTTGGKTDIGDNLYFEDIYQAKSADKKWASPTQPDINRKFHDAGAALSPDGKKLYLYRDNRKTKGDLYEADYDSNTNQWGKAKKLNKNINSKYQETSLSLSKDGNTMYFASDRPGGMGGLDIYVSRKEEKGDWGKAENIDKTINTTFDDDAPFISFDGQYLYFCSKGHASVGGYDVFKSKSLGESNWSEPENLGNPINTPEDDLHLVLSADNKSGYYVSADDAGFGDKDIYKLSAPKLMLVKLDKTGLDITQPGLLTTIKGDTTTIGKPDFKFDVQYGFNQTNYLPTSKESIANLLAYMKNNPDVRVEIGGHTCNIGTYQINKIISLGRAKSIANYLIANGIDANRIQVTGYSYDKPLVPNDSPANRALNRRAEYMILDE